MTTNTIADWHQIVRTRNAAGLNALLAENVVFHSPVVHAPQVGKAITRVYLTAALAVFFNESFRYVREEGRIVDFKVMLRPLKAINLIHQKMGAMLQAAK